MQENVVQCLTLLGIAGRGREEVHGAPARGPQTQPPQLCWTLGHLDVTLALP